MHSSSVSPDLPGGPCLPSFPIPGPLGRATLPLCPSVTQGRFLPAHPICRLAEGDGLGRGLAAHNRQPESFVPSDLVVTLLGNGSGEDSERRPQPCVKRLDAGSCKAQPAGCRGGWGHGLRSALGIVLPHTVLEIMKQKKVYGLLPEQERAEHKGCLFLGQ